MHRSRLAGFIIDCETDDLDAAAEFWGIGFTIDIIHRMEGTVIGADIVCYNPRRDINDMTAMVAVKLLKEVAGRMLTDNA